MALPATWKTFALLRVIMILYSHQKMFTSLIIVPIERKRSGKYINYAIKKVKKVRNYEGDS